MIAVTVPPSLYSIDIKHLETPNARDAIDDAARAVESATSPADAIAAYETLLRVWHRYDAYLTIRHATNTEDQASLDEARAVAAIVDGATNKLRARLAAVESVPHYDYFVRRMRALGTRPPECETLAPFVEGWQSDLHELLPDNRDAAAFALVHLVRERSAIAKLHGFPDAIAEAYANSEWTRKQVDALLDGVAAHVDLYRQYKAASSAASMPATTPQFTIEEARALLLDVVRPLGPAYGRELAQLLDPANRRLDILPGPHRQHGGFSVGFPGTTSLFYMAGFTGTYNDVRVLAHESTHAVQRQLESAHGVSPLYADGPHYLFEAAAVMNELLLPSLLAGRATDPALRRYYLQQFLGGKGIDVIFVAAAEAALEEAVYDGVVAGTIRNANDLDALTARVMARFGIAPARSWMKIALMYEDPFYDVNYVWAGIIGLRMFGELQRDPAHFGARYTAMLQNGFDRPVAQLLRDFTGIDVDDPALLDKALAVVKPKIDQLAAP